jgi:outer membrane cobalamin receptor
MKQLIVSILFTFFSLHSFAQATIDGRVTDIKGEPIIGASVSIPGTYDGTITDVNGHFSFTSYEEGVVPLLISYLGYESKNIEGDISTLLELNIKLRESVVALDAVEITASTFKAGDNSKIAVLKPLDVVTTAGSMGDVIAAMQTLPGTQSNAEDGRLFIRGGEARETNIYIDGLKVFTPYTRTIGGTPSRGRFSPFLFRGVSFSTGGYSAAYGQALSGILDMNTIDEPDVTETNISLMTVGLGLGHTQKWDQQSLSLSTAYTDLQPYLWLVPSRADWIDPYAGFSGEAVYRYKTEKGLLKSYLSTESNGFQLYNNNIDTGLEEKIDINNTNLYSNTSYHSILNDQHTLYAGLSIGYNSDKLNIDSAFQQQHILRGLHARLALKTYFGERFITQYGLDILNQSDDFSRYFGESEMGGIVSRNITGAFIETDYFFSRHLAIKTGLRVEHHSLTGKTHLNPRVTIAQKISKNSQVSAAYGLFTQEIDGEFLLHNEQLAQERSEHFLLNYNFKNDKHILRVESYYKNYRNLLAYNGTNGSFSEVNNAGNGYAYGLDFFWRANQLIDNIDFWISYSWLEHERNYRDFPERATPAFATRHNLSVVSKIWIPRLRSQLGLTWNYTSGRPYEDPNTDGFLNERSKSFRNISLSWSYLISQQKILFVSVSNPTNFKNEFGYEFGSTPNEDGLYPGRLIRPNDDQFFFAGFFITLSKDKLKNQLNNL